MLRVDSMQLQPNLICQSFGSVSLCPTPRTAALCFLNWTCLSPLQPWQSRGTGLPQPGTNVMLARPTKARGRPRFLT